MDHQTALACSVPDSVHSSSNIRNCRHLLKRSALQVHPQIFFFRTRHYSPKRLRHFLPETDGGIVSPYSLSTDIEEASHADGQPFTLVTHYKGGPPCIPIIFWLIHKTSFFWRVNLNKLAAEIVTITQRFTAHQIKKGGTQAVASNCLSTAKKLLSITRLAGCHAPSFSFRIPPP